MAAVADKLAKILAELRRNPKNVRFADLLLVCRHFFGEPRSHGTLALRLQDAVAW